MQPQLSATGDHTTLTQAADTLQGGTSRSPYQKPSKLIELTLQALEVVLEAIMGRSLFLWALLLLPLATLEHVAAHDASSPPTSSETHSAQVTAATEKAQAQKQAKETKNAKELAKFTQQEKKLTQKTRRQLRWSQGLRRLGFVDSAWLGALGRGFVDAKLYITVGRMRGGAASSSGQGPLGTVHNALSGAGFNRLARKLRSYGSFSFPETLQYLRSKGQNPQLANFLEASFNLQQSPELNLEQLVQRTLAWNTPYFLRVIDTVLAQHATWSTSYFLATLDPELSSLPPPLSESQALPGQQQQPAQLQKPLSEILAQLTELLTPLNQSLFSEQRHSVQRLLSFLNTAQAWYDSEHQTMLAGAFIPARILRRFQRHAPNQAPVNAVTLAQLLQWLQHEQGSDQLQQLALHFREIPDPQPTTAAIPATDARQTQTQAEAPPQENLGLARSRRKWEDYRHYENGYTFVKSFEKLFNAAGHLSTEAVMGAYKLAGGVAPSNNDLGAGLLSSQQIAIAEFEALDETLVRDNAQFTPRQWEKLSALKREIQGDLFQDPRNRAAKEHLAQSMEHLRAIMQLPRTYKNLPPEELMFTHFENKTSTYEPLVRDSLRRVLSDMIQRTQLEKSSPWISRAFLLQGPAGTGKTASVELLAEILDLPLCKISLTGETLTQFAGSAATRDIGTLARCFIHPSQGGKPTLNPIIFFDEAHYLLNQDSEGANRFKAFLQELIEGNSKSYFLESLGVDFNISGATFIFNANESIKSAAGAFESRLIPIDFPAFSKATKKAIAYQSFLTAIHQLRLEEKVRPEDFQAIDQLVALENAPGARNLLVVLKDWIMTLHARQPGGPSGPSTDQPAFNFVEALASQSAHTRKKQKAKKPETESELLAKIAELKQKARDSLLTPEALLPQQQPEPENRNPN